MDDRTWLLSVMWPYNGFLNRNERKEINRNVRKNNACSFLNKPLPIFAFGDSLNTLVALLQ
ncbi:hypothetical protein BH09BAC1_BH09BAC1_19820 [soil metagenome]